MISTEVLSYIDGDDSGPNAGVTTAAGRYDDPTLLYLDIGGGYTFYRNRRAAILTAAAAARPALRLADDVERTRTRVATVTVVETIVGGVVGGGSTTTTTTTTTAHSAEYAALQRRRRGRRYVGNGIAQMIVVNRAA